MDKPPPYPWIKGKHPDHEVVIVEVEVCKDEHGRVFSAHKLQAEEDESLSMEWPTGGQQQVAHALLVEALRREAVVGLLLRLSKDPEYLTKLSGMSEEERGQEVTGMAGAMLRVVGQSAHSMAESIVKEALASMLPR